jgi:hypothetical protein
MEQKVTEAKREGPFYTGMYTHFDAAGGYALTLPTDWHKIPMKEGVVGMMFSPYVDDINTSITALKHILDYKVQPGDMDVLRKGFEDGIRKMPGVDIDRIDASYSNTINFFDAQFSFMDGGVRRKRWVRNIYWGEAQLVLVAQGRTVEDYEHWLPMFFNTITTCNIL